MKTKLVLVGFALLSLFLLNGTAVLAQLDPLTDYEDFNGKKYNGCKNCINSEKWGGLQQGDHVAEMLREIKAKSVRLSHRSWGKTDSDVGIQRGRNRMNFRNSLNMSGACFVPRVKKYEVQDCDANDDTSQVLIRYFGNFYDANDEDLGGEDGNVYAGIEMSRHADSIEKKGVFEVSAWVIECEGGDCDTFAWSTFDEIDDPDLNFGTVKAKSNKEALCVGYDRANQEFVFSFGDDVKTVNAVDHGLPSLDSNIAADWTWHVIETRIDVENCSAGAKSGFIDAGFDNVMIREFP